MRIFIIGLVLLSTSAASYADATLETQKKNAFLTLSAFECAAVSPNDKETERLFTLGLKAGRDFIQFVQTNRDIYLKTLKSKVPILWNMTSGPTSDFILGQIYADRVDDVYKEFSTDEELWKVWKVKRQNMYKEKNCALLGK